MTTTPQPAKRYNRGYLPHFDADYSPQFINYRLHDSLPAKTLERWKRMASDADQAEVRKKIERYLDRGYGNCYLRRAEVASVVEDALLDSDGEMVRLHAWVVMPNHAHLLYSPAEGVPLKQVMKKLKGSTAYDANRILGRTGTYWMADYHDRFVRDQVHFNRAVRYIERNPVKAGLCKAEHEWRWSSAWWKHKAAEAKAEDAKEIERLVGL